MFFIFKYFFTNKIWSFLCFYLPSLEIGELRLRGGYKDNEGRVEAFRSGEWGTICDDRWDINDANVVCRQLGYGSAVEATHWADHGEGLGKVGQESI